MIEPSEGDRAFLGISGDIALVGLGMVDGVQFWASMDYNTQYLLGSF